MGNSPQKVGTVKNPLTVIAIFAGIAEVSGTAVLPFVRPENQATFIYFLMWFPTLLVILFFLMLFFKPEVLYAPSDYQDEDNFLRALRAAPYESRLMKLRDEARDISLDQRVEAVD